MTEKQDQCRHEDADPKCLRHAAGLCGASEEEVAEYALKAKEEK